MKLAEERFQFIEPGLLVDGELELVAPQPRFLDELLTSCRHPRTVTESPDEAGWSRTELEDYLEAAPRGRLPPDPHRGRVPQYDFWMRRRDAGGFLSGLFHPSLRILGGLTLRVATSPNVELYYGHIGYHVFPAARGRHYAERACRLLLPLARAHGLNPLWITCNPENIASRRTCERLGMKLVETVAIPSNEPLYTRGERVKCRYRLDL